MMKIFGWFRSSGFWAPLAAAALFMLAVLTKTIVGIAVGYVGLVVAGLYACWFAPDAMRVGQLRTRAKRCSGRR